MNIFKSVLFISIIIFHFESPIFAQKITVVGNVTNTKNEPLAFSDVILTTADSSNVMLAFGMADNNGDFLIEWEKDTIDVQLEVSSMGYAKGYKKLTLQPGKLKYTINFNLEVRTEEIDEVSVKAAPIVQTREDTTFFNLAMIRDSSEVVVEDLIKKLPGMTVEDDGRIKFKGKEVKKVLLDGDDLFENNYTLGTKNIQADHVEGITAVENYTHNPLLRGVEITEDVAINLEFRPGLSLSNNLKAGYGPDNRYGITHKGIAITKKVKAFTLLDHNTLGSMGSNDINFRPSMYLSRINNKNSQAPIFLGLSNTATQAERNESYFGSINILPHLTETFTARLNMDYFSDKAKNESYYKQIITADPDNPITIEQRNQQTDLPRFFSGKLYMEKYLSKTDRIDNTIFFTRRKNSSDNWAINNNVEQQLDKSANDHYFNNVINYTKRLKNNRSLTLTCEISSDESTEELLLMPGVDFETSTFNQGQITTQDIKSKKQGIDLRTGFLVSLFKKHKINIGLNSTLYNTTLGTFLSGSASQNQFSNDIDYSVFIPNASLSYEYKYKKLKINPSLRFRLYNYDYKNAVSQLSKNETDFLMDATINIAYTLMPRHTINVGLNSTETAPEDDKVYDNYILTSNRLLKNNQIDFGAQTSQSANITYSYQSLLSDLNYSVGVNYNKNNYQYQTIYGYSQNFLNMQTNYLSNNGSSGYGINANIGVKMRKILDRVNLSYNYSNNEYMNAVNSDVEMKNRSEQNTYSLNFQTKVFWKMYFDSRSSYSQSAYYTESKKMSENKNLSSNFSLHAIFFKRLSAKAYYNYLVPSVDNFDNANQSLNAALRLSNKKKNVIFTLDAQNLIDQKQNNQVTNNEHSTTYSSNNMQRRYLLFAVEVRF